MNRWPLTMVLFVPSIIYLVTHVNVRYRYSTVWTMALLGGYAVSQLITWWQNRRERCDLFTCVDNSNCLVTDRKSASRTPILHQ